MDKVDESIDTPPRCFHSTVVTQGAVFASVLRIDAFLLSLPAPCAFAGGGL
jgi:hypothetical protein